MVVMHAKMAASKGSSRSMFVQIIDSISMVNGWRLEDLDDAGANMVAPSRIAFYSFTFTDHGRPCRRCQALSPAA